MTMPTKSSRKLEVGNIAYRWMVSFDEDCGGNFDPSHIVIELEGGNSSVVSVYFPWLNEENSRTSELHVKITPSLVKDILIQLDDFGVDWKAKKTYTFVRITKKLIEWKQWWDGNRT